MSENETSPLPSPYPTIFNHVSLRKTRKNQANSACELTKNRNVSELLSAAIWNPVPETCSKAIYAALFAAWLGLTSKLVRKHLDKQAETSQGHMCADRKKVRSIKHDIVNLTTDSTNIKNSNPVRANAFISR